MRNILKATTLENKFPLFTVENGCIVSKDADITVAFRVELPELFTVTAAEKRTFFFIINTLFLNCRTGG